jgi:Fe-S oxidoreductase
LEAIDFEDESLEQFGATTLTDLSQTQLVDPFACIMCNRCQEVCPAYVTGKELSPSALEINKRYYIWEHLGGLAAGEEDATPLLDYAISESAVWACTSCGACVEVCPVGNEPMLDILDLRRSQVLMESNFPQALKGAFTGMERNANPWQMSEDRLAWAKPLDFEVPTVEQNPDYEILYWVGCAGAFDPTAQEIARATATVLHAAGLNFAVLGNQEACTGDVARRAGNEYLFFEMAQANIETLQGIEADRRKIVANCPHCLQTIGKEYADFGGHFTVQHHTQLISELIGSGQLKLNGQKLEQVTFHDPCYLGRHNQIFEAPREVLAQAGATLLEMERSRSDSFCCGAGGAQMWKEEERGSQAVNLNRYTEAKATGAQTLAIGCPFCARMLNDANNAAGAPMQVKDVAEVVAAAIKD